MDSNYSLFDEEDINELHFSKVAVNPSDSSSANVLPIKKIEDISVTEFESRYRNKQSVLIPGCIKSWKAVLEWCKPEYLINLLDPQREVQVFVAKDNRNFLDNVEVTEKKQMSIERLIQSVFVEYDDKNFESNTQNRYYYRDLLEHGLWEDVDPLLLWKKFIDESATTHSFNHSLIRLWLGTAGNTTPLHFDRCHGLLCQVVGTKKMTQYSPEDTRNLYPFDGLSTKSHCSRVSLYNYYSHPDPSVRERERTAYPKFERAQPYEVTLHPGDVLYTPPGWWHDVVSTSNSISITIPFNMTADEAVPPNMLV